MPRIFYRSRFGLHFQRIPSWAPELIAGTEAFEWIKIIDPPPENPFPSKRIIGRIYHNEGEDNKLIMQGTQGADTYFNQCLPTYNRLPYVEVWEGPNESPVSTQEQRAKLVEFELRWIQLMHDKGLFMTNRARKAAALSLSVGWPDVGTGHEFADVAIEADYIALHEYSAPSMKDDEGWHCLRYRKFVAELAAVGVAAPQIMITEAGIDGGVLEDKGDEKEGDGWKSFTDETGYLHQLIRYDQRITQLVDPQKANPVSTNNDPYVVCFTPFTSGPYEDWIDFDVGENLVKRIAGYVASVTPPPEPPPTPPEPPPGPPPPIPPEPPASISEAIREEAYNQAGINYNPDAAFTREARERELGAPKTGEFDLGKYRAQGFDRGILFCLVPRWNEIEFVSW